MPWFTSVAVDVVNYMTLNSIIFCAGNEWRVGTSGGNIGSVKSLESETPPSPRHFKSQWNTSNTHIYLYNIPSTILDGHWLWTWHCGKCGAVVLPLVQCALLKDSNTVGRRSVLYNILQIPMTFWGGTSILLCPGLLSSPLLWSGLGPHCLCRKGMLLPATLPWRHCDILHNFRMELRPGVSAGEVTTFFPCLNLGFSVCEYFRHILDW